MYGRAKSGMSLYKLMDKKRGFRSTQKCSRTKKDSLKLKITSKIRMNSKKDNLKQYTQHSALDKLNGFLYIYNVSWILVTIGIYNFWNQGFLSFKH